jgi:hypothetical protein
MTVLMINLEISTVPMEELSVGFLELAHALPAMKVLVGLTVLSVQKATLTKLHHVSLLVKFLKTLLTMEHMKMKVTSTA